MPFSEAQSYAGLLGDAVKKYGGGWKRRFAVMRHTAVYETEPDRKAAIGAVSNVLGQFGNLMLNKGDVVNGFPEQIPFDQLEGILRVDPATLEENLMFGTPEEVVRKLELYRDIGADAFICYVSMGHGMAEQRRSLELFIEKVMPHFSA